MKSTRRVITTLVTSVILSQTLWAAPRPEFQYSCPPPNIDWSKAVVDSTSNTFPQPSP